MQRQPWPDLTVNFFMYFLKQKVMDNSGRTEMNFILGQPCNDIRTLENVQCKEELGVVCSISVTKETVRGALLFFTFDNGSDVVINASWIKCA